MPGSAPPHPAKMVKTAGQWRGAIKVTLSNLSNSGITTTPSGRQRTSSSQEVSLPLSFKQKSKKPRGSSAGNHCIGNQGSKLGYPWQMALYKEVKEKIITRQGGGEGLRDVGVFLKVKV